jgi:hypothetical protein
MQTFSQQDTLNLPKIDAYLLQLIKPDLVNGPWIAGGAVLQWFNKSTVGSHDVDVFFKNERQFQSLLDFFQKAALSNFELDSNNIKNCSLIFSSDNAYTFKYDQWHIQLIKTHFFDSVDALLNHFDITACKLATDGTQWYTNHPSTIDHIENKILDMDRIRSDMAVKRLFKYWIYGYQPTVDLIERLQQTPDLENNFSNSTDYDS